MASRRRQRHSPRATCPASSSGSAWRVEGSVSRQGQAPERPQPLSGIQGSPVGSGLLERWLAARDRSEQARPFDDAAVQGVWPRGCRVGLQELQAAESRRRETLCERRRRERGGRQRRRDAREGRAQGCGREGASAERHGAAEVGWKCAGTVYAWRIHYTPSRDGRVAWRVLAPPR